MVGAFSSPGHPVYDILIDDADGRKLLVERLQDLAVARQRLRALSSEHAGVRLILWNQQTRTILAETEGY
jgi:hypothetical protein